MKYFSYIVIGVVGAAVVAGFFIIGSPANERLRKYDERRISDLQNISYAVNLYWQNSNNLPENLELLLNNNFYYINSLNDPASKELYEYRILEERKYELCANFETDSSLSQDRSIPKPVSQEKWDYVAGRNCFQREVFIENIIDQRIIR